MRPPRGEQWSWRPVVMQKSDAWRALCIYSRRFLDFLEIEHFQHAGQENGNLKAPYDQLTAFGIPRNKVKTAIEETEFFGFIKVTQHGGRWAGSNQPSKYCLTYYPTAKGYDVYPPTNDWKRADQKRVAAWKNLLKEKRGRSNGKKNRFGSTAVRTAVVPTGELPNHDSEKSDTTAPPEHRLSRVVS